MKTEKTTAYSKMLLVLVLTLLIPSVSWAEDGIWTPKADMPTPRYLLDSCVLDGKIYAIGGAPRPHAGLSVVEVYDPVTDTWTNKADMLVPRAGLGVSVVDGVIYAIGGVTSTSTASVEAYDPATDTWTRKADMPTSRGFFTTSVVDDTIYAIGGAQRTDGPFFATVEAYDPAADTWTRKADLPEPRYLHTAGVVDGKIYVIAGSPRNWTASNAVFEYDPVTDVWARKADAPTVRSWQSPHAAVVDGRIFVFGGDGGPPDAEVEEYDPVTDTWTVRPDMPTPRGALSTVALDDQVYVLGGMTDFFNALDTVEAYDPYPLPDVPGDFDDDGQLTVMDIDMLTTEVLAATHPPEYDLNDDALVDGLDRRVWIEELKNTWLGDANLDLEFNSSDMVQVFVAGKYESDENAGWAEGDWDGSGVFDSTDMVTAFVGGGYEKGLKVPAVAVPEPTSVLWLVIGLIGLAIFRRPLGS